MLWNSRHIDATAKTLTGKKFPVTDEMIDRPSPLRLEHINFLGRYAFTQPDITTLRSLREPDTSTAGPEPR